MRASTGPATRREEGQPRTPAWTACVRCPFQPLFHLTAKPTSQPQAMFSKLRVTAQRS